VADALTIGNCSGFYGDRLSAMREMLDGGGDGQRPDVLTGDYLAELTMLILGKDTLKDASLGYAKTFLRQVEDCLGLALERGVRLVSNAGGLNPAGLAERIREVAQGLGLDPAVAYVEGDDLRGHPAVREVAEGALTANAYLGGFGIARALEQGADVVVTGRVTDASLVVGPAVAHHGWSYADRDQLAGAVVAGHVLECGTQATGGNFSGFRSLDRSRPLGFPLAEIAADGSSVITKQDGTGGAVTVDTVTAQLVYEIQSTRYLGPDVTTDLTSIALRQEGEDRVRISGVRGETPPERLKVAVNELGGWRNSVEFVLTGLEIEEKADWLREQLAGLDAETVQWSELRPPAPDADTEEGASALLRCTVMDPDAAKVGKPFTGPAIELALASYPGFTVTAPPGRPTAYGIYRPAYVPRDAVTHTVVHADGRRETIPEPPLVEQGALAVVEEGAPAAVEEGAQAPVSKPPAAGGFETVASATLRDGRFATSSGTASSTTGETRPAVIEAPLGTFVYARSGDKGGDANLGLWVVHDDSPRYPDRVAWLTDLVTPDTVRRLVPEAADLEIEVHPLPNLGGVNVLVRGLLGQGVAASTRFDPQAKALGEWVRSRHVPIPVELCPEGVL